MSDPARFDAVKNLIHVGASRLVFHCHHYNLALQRTVDDALGAEAVLLQRAAAAESAERMLGDLFASEGGTARAKIDRAAELFRGLGFGKADASGLDGEGGSVVLATSHYAIGHEAKFGKATAPICHFAVGFWMGALAAAMKLPMARITGREERCAAMAGESCALRIEVL